MTVLLAILSILLAITAAAYLQVPTFVLALGYRWFHNYKAKRWVLRIFATAAFVLFVSSDPSIWVSVAIGLPFLFFLVFSLFNANPKVYIALNESQIIKESNNIYARDTEMLGFVDESGNAIAYPLVQMIKPRHLLNDAFMGNPLFVSYCMACRSAMLYKPVVKGQRLNFEVLGVFRRNMVMRDIETGTIWQQGTGEAVYGKLKGTQLEYLPYQQMSVKEWLLLYPDSLIAYEAVGVGDGIFSKERLMKMMKVTERLIAPGKTDLSGLPPREKIFGVQIGNDAKAYPVEKLKTVSGAFKDYIGKTEVTVEYNKDTNHISITESKTGKKLVAQSHWWFGWKEFHPFTIIWEYIPQQQSSVFKIEKK